MGCWHPRIDDSYSSPARWHYRALALQESLANVRTRGLLDDQGKNIAIALADFLRSADAVYTQNLRGINCSLSDAIGARMLCGRLVEKQHGIYDNQIITQELAEHLRILEILLSDRPRRAIEQGTYSGFEIFLGNLAVA